MFEDYDIIHITYIFYDDLGCSYGDTAVRVIITCERATYLI